MHPNREKLKALVEKKLESREISPIKTHLEECALCCEFVDNYTIYYQQLLTIQAEPKNNLLDKLTNSLAISDLSNIITLVPLGSTQSNEMHLAADGHSEPDSLNSRTFFSTDPEMVLRLINDRSTDQCYLQLLSDDPEENAFVMIKTVDNDQSFITNKDGVVHLASDDSQKLMNAEKWQVKLPDAVFQMEPLEYDPEEIKFSDETILTTDKDDQIKIIIERKNKGKELKIEILKLNGSNEIGSVKLALSLSEAEPIERMINQKDKQASFTIDDLNQTLNIRIFHK